MAASLIALGVDQGVGGGDDQAQASNVILAFGIGKVAVAAFAVPVFLHTVGVAAGFDGLVMIQDMDMLFGGLGGRSDRQTGEHEDSQNHNEEVLHDFHSLHSFIIFLRGSRRYGKRLRLPIPQKDPKGPEIILSSKKG